MKRFVVFAVIVTAKLRFRMVAEKPTRPLKKIYHSIFIKVDSEKNRLVRLVFPLLEHKQKY